MHTLCSVRNGFDYAVCILSKTPLTADGSGIPQLDGSGLWLEAGIPEHNFSLGVVHAPTSPRTRMREYLDGLVTVAAAKRESPFLFIGDFNTSIGPADGPLKNFGDTDRFISIQANGFADAWRGMNGDLTEHSYTWPRSGKSYRIDHALASRSLLSRIRGCRYSHEERYSGISDHSLFLVEMGD